MLLADYYADCITQLLSDSDGENCVFSPINLYFSLAMLAEITDGDTQSQILDLIGMPDTDTLRMQANALWNYLYSIDNNLLTLANSAWLADDLLYDQSVMDTLSQAYYADIYQCNFSDSAAGSDIRAWLNNKTNGILQESVSKLLFPAETELVLASTVYMRARWYQEFSEEENTEGVFHASSSNEACTYMNKSTDSRYYWGEDYSAIHLTTCGSETVWFILPDEGKTVDDLLESGAYMELFSLEDDEQHEADADASSGSVYAKIHMSIPKFDVTYTGILNDDLQALGVTNVFDSLAADFSTAFPEAANLYMDTVEQSTRISIDEEGVEAASYVVNDFVGWGFTEPDKEVAFVLDRPFLIVVTSGYSIPVFAGLIQNP